MHTFREAAASYVAQGGEGRYLEKLSTYFEGRDIDTIVPAEFRQCAIDLSPHLKASSRNRQFVCPARAVMYHAHDCGWIGPMRIRRFKTEKSHKFSPVDGQWLGEFIAQCEQDGLFRLAALIIFINHTAARISEAVNLEWQHVNMRERIATLVKTKTGINQIAYLTDELIFRFYNMERMEGERVFSYTSRFSVNERIKAVCRRANIKAYTSHSIGRYSFATNALKNGHDLKTAMEAGRWKSSTIFLETYVNPDNAGREVAQGINKRRYQFL